MAPRLRFITAMKKLFVPTAILTLFLFSCQSPYNSAAHLTSGDLGSGNLSQGTPEDGSATQPPKEETQDEVTQARPVFPPILTPPEEVAPPRAVDFNTLVLESLKEMPVGGGYSLGADAGRALKKATSWKADTLELFPKPAQPSYCSGATYILFLKAILKAFPDLKTNERVAKKLLLLGQGDGVSVYGRWNANGPGTARLFYELKIGRNFDSWEEAKPGDFMKIFWDSNIGKSEKGHSVVYLGTSIVKGVPMVEFWSSNQPGGYGSKKVEKSRVKRVIFSRVVDLQKILDAPALPEKDLYLADMLKRASSPAEMAQMIDLNR